MSLSFKGLLRNTYRCQLQFVRHKNKINITHPRPPHFVRAVVENVCVPRFNLPRSLPYVPLYDECEKRLIKAENQIHPLEAIMAKEVFDWLNKSQLIAIFHKNYTDTEDEFDHLVLLRKNGIKVLDYSKKVMNLGLRGTIFEPILLFYKSHTIVGISKEPDINTLMSILKHLPLITLMAAVVNNRLLDYAQLKKYGEIQSIDEARMKLVGLLTMAPQNLVNQLNYHPTSLVHSLKQIEESKK